tara:strand:+ start:74 stop:688 length:615 start_codon:yes stop_codon:yes gene_type:complete
MYKKKPLIIFEGIEGSGKSTQIKNIISFLKKKKLKYIKLREPGGVTTSEKIRKLILNKKSKFNPLTDLLLYNAARNENVNNVIKKYYKKKIIIIDRFIYSTIAYQHYGMQLDLKLINILNKKILKNMKIDHIFFHKIRISTMKKRIKKRNNNNRYDEFENNFYKKVQYGYNKIFKKMKNVTTINSEKDLAENKKEVLNKFSKLI